MAAFSFDIRTKQFVYLTFAIEQQLWHYALSSSNHIGVWLITEKILHKKVGRRKSYTIKHGKGGKEIRKQNNIFTSTNTESKFLPHKVSIPQPLSPSTQKLNAHPQKEQIGQQLQLLLEWLYLLTYNFVFVL